MSSRRIPRLYLDCDLTRHRAPLTERDTKYLGSVLRMKRGDQVLAFNGRGHERHATIATLARTHGELTLLDFVEPLPESALALTLVQALPKTEAMDLIVQKTTELGVHALWPVTSDFSVVRLDSERAERRALHWQRIAQSACEQCGRHRPPDIRPLQTLADALEHMPRDSTRFVLDPRGAHPLTSSEPPAGELFMLIGPEGGFSETDLEQIERQGARPLRLGPRTLRAETAAIVVAGVAQALWGDLR